MEDLNELYKLLERADAAGDDESVATLIPYIKQVETAAASQPAKKEPVDVTQPQPDLAQPPVVKPADDSSDFFRGMRAYLPETKATLSGAEALLGKQIGSEKLMRAGVKGYEEASKELAPLSRDTDTIQGAIDKGIGAVVTDFLPYWAGKGVGMLGESLAFSILGGVVGSAVPGGGTAVSAITSLVSRSLVKKGLKEAVEKIAKEKGDDAAKSFIEKETSKFMASEAGQKAVNKELGKRVGIGVMAGIHGEGEVMGQAIQHATQTITDPEEKIRAVNDLSTGRLTTAAAGHALGDYFAAKIGLDALDNLASPTKNFVMSVVKNWAITGVKEVPPELLQTALERFGADMPLADKEAINDYINTAAAAFGMASIPGAYGGISGAVQARKTTETEKPIETDPLTGEQRPSRETLKKQTLKDLEDKANEINKAKADKAARLKAAQQQQVVTEAADLESMAPVNPTELTDNTLTSWGLSKNSKAYKTLIGQDAGTPEGRTLIDTALEAHTGKINEPAVDTYKSLLDQQKVEATNEPQTDTGPGIDTGTIGINNEVPGQPKYGTPGTAAGYNEPTVNISGTPTTLPKRGEADVNAPLKAKTSFTTKRGSTYDLFDDNTTIRNRSGKDSVDTSTGIQPRSGKTIFLNSNDLNNFGAFQNPDIPTQIVPNGNEALLIVSEDHIGYKKGQILAKAPFALEPKVGLHPVEIYDSKSPLGSAGEGVHFGTAITNIQKQQGSKQKLKPKAPVEEVAPVSTQPRLASQLRALDSTNPLIEALQFDQASEEEVAVAQNTIKELQASRKAKKADLTKVSEEEKDIPLEARGEIQNTGETPDTIEGAFQKQYGKNVRLAKQRGLLNFLNDVSELPPEVGPVTPGTKAVYHKGKGYFITNRITREDAPRMLLHEIGAHYGLEGMLGTTNYKRVVKQIKQNHLTDKELRASWDNTVKTYPEYPEGSNNFMQEVIANIGETAPNNSIFRQIVGYIKQFLSKLGYGWDINKITADDIRDMVQQSVRMSLAGKIKGTQPGITMKGEEDTGAPKPTYYSQLTRIVTNAVFPRNITFQPADQWISWINSKASEGIKKDELEFSGVIDYLKMRGKDKINKQELINYLEDNGPQVSEFKLGVDEEGNVPDDAAKNDFVDQNLKEWIDTNYGDDPEGQLYQTATENAIEAYDFPYYVKEENITDSEGNKGYRVYMEHYTSGPIDNTYYFSEDEAQETVDEYNNGGMDSYADEVYKSLKRDFDQDVETKREELEFEFDGFTGPIATKYGHVTLKGGEINYAEVILSLRNPLERRKLKDITVIEGKYGWSIIDRDTGILFDQDEDGTPIEYNSEAVAYNRAMEIKGGSYRVPKNEPTKFTHFHWEGVNNPIAHYRVNQRMDNTGARVLFVEEIQSDWAQSPKTLRKQYIRKLAKQYNIKPKQMADFVPGDWGFKKQLPDAAQKELNKLEYDIKRYYAEAKDILKEEKKYYQLETVEEDRLVKIVKQVANSQLQSSGVAIVVDYLTRPPVYRNAVKNGQVSDLIQDVVNILIDNAAVTEIVADYRKYRQLQSDLGHKHFDAMKLYNDALNKKTALLGDQENKIERGPWVTDTEAWSNLILKNIVRFAIDQGYEKVAFVNGKQAAYKGGRLEEFEEVFVTRNNNNTYNIHATLKDEGGRTRDIPNIRDEELEEYVGSIANDIRALQPGETEGWDADKIKIASQGMKEFYDNYIPRYVSKLLKKMGGGNLETISFEAPNAYAPPEQRIGEQVGFTITQQMANKSLQGQPLFARASKQQLDDDLKNSGTVGKEKEPKPTTFDRFKDKPLKTIDEIIANFRKSFFSFDAAINNKILIAMRQQKIPQQEVAKSFYEMQVGQALHADQLSDMWMVHGGIKYDPESFSFMIEDVKDSMSTIREQLSAIAKKRNISEFEMFQYGHAAFVAQRSQGLNESNEDLKKKVLKLLVDGKKAAAREAMDNYKLVSLTPAQIEYGMNFFKTIPELKKIHKTWNKNRRRLLQFAVDNGLYTTEKAEDLLDVIDFVPFYREAQDEDKQIPKPFTRGILDTAIDKRLKGSYRPVNNVFDNMERWASYTLKKAINNKAAQEKIKFYSKYLPDDIKIIKGTSTTGNAVGVWYDGKVVKYEFQGYDGKSMVDGFTGLEPVVNLVVPKILNKYATFQRAQIVLEPLFNAAQITMDAFDALFSSGIELPVLLPLQVVKEVLLSPLGLSKARTFLTKSGDVGKRDWASEYNNIDLEAMKQLKQLKTSDKIIKAVLSPVVASYKGLKFLGMASDNIIRQAVWSQIMLETGNVARATYVAREIINFRRTGSNAYISAARQMAPFVNANLQAANIAFGTMLFSGITPDSKVVQLRRLITSGAQVTAAILILTALNSDDDDYKKLDPKDRDRLLMLPGSGGYALPVRGSIITLIYKILPEHLYNRYIEESEDSEKLRKSLTEAFKRAIALPTGFPTLVTPVLEMALNLDTVTGLPLRGQSQKDLEADLQYSNKYTSQLARWANDATGISPIVVQNFMNRWLASTSMLVSMFTNKLIADIRGEMLPEKTSKEKFLQLPSGNKFVTKQQNTRNINDYYELNDIVNSIVDSANKYKNIDYPKYQEYIAKDNRAEIINMRKEMSVISKELQLLRDYENKIYASKDANRWTPATKKAELDRLEGIRQNMLGSQLQLKERSDRYIQQLRYRGGL